MRNKPDYLITYVNLDNTGKVYLYENGTIINSNKTLEDFEHIRISASRHIRICGLVKNINLILKYYLLKKQGILLALEVCTPQCIYMFGKDLSIEEEFTCMDMWDTSRSTGGWTDLDDTVFYSLKLSALQKVIEKRYFKVLLQDHTVYKAGINFISHLDSYSILQLLTQIIEPRWFIDIDRPDRNNKLEAFLGLVPRTQLAVYNKKSHGYNIKRCELVQKCWFNKPEDPSLPSAFLWRIFKAHKEGPMAFLRTSQYFIEFLKTLWLQQLFPNLDLFIPEYFFKEKSDARAFREYTKSYCIDSKIR